MNTLLLIAALQVCWVAPTENVDGSQLTDLASYNIYYGDATRNYTDTLPVPDPTALCHPFEPAPGTYFVAMTALDADGNESAYSNEVLKTVIDTSPLPPVILPTETAVFTVKMQPDVFLLFNVGIVPAGTECYLDRGAPAGYGVVPFEDVVWTDPAGPRPIAVVAQCNG